MAASTAGHEDKDETQQEQRFHQALLRCAARTAKHEADLREVGVSVSFLLRTWERESTLACSAAEKLERAEGRERILGNMLQSAQERMAAQSRPEPEPEPEPEPDAAASCGGGGGDSRLALLAQYSEAIRESGCRGGAVGRQLLNARSAVLFELERWVEALDDCGGMAGGAGAPEQEEEETEEETELARELGLRASLCCLRLGRLQEARARLTALQDPELLPFFRQLEQAEEAAAAAVAAAEGDERSAAQEEEEAARAAAVACSQQEAAAARRQREELSRALRKQQQEEEEVKEAERLTEVRLSVRRRHEAQAAAAAAAARQAMRQAVAAELEASVRGRHFEDGGWPPCMAAYTLSPPRAFVAVPRAQSRLNQGGNTQCSRCSAAQWQRPRRWRVAVATELKVAGVGESRHSRTARRSVAAAPRPWPGPIALRWWHTTRIGRCSVG
jgi:hypothetical protein